MGNRPGHDPDNNDLYAALLSLTPASGAMAVKAAPAVVSARPDRLDAIERTAIQRMRNLRVNTGAGELRLMRGEFRRLKIWPSLVSKLRTTNTEAPVGKRHLKVGQRCL